ncbi:hypothetical protein V8C26DRAFT_259100 [Trichoderma gracile]
MGMPSLQVRALCRRVQPKVQRHTFSHGLLHLTTKTFIRNLNLQANERASFRYNKLRRFESCLQMRLAKSDSGSNTAGPLLRTTASPNLSFAPRFQLGARPARQRMVPKKRSTGLQGIQPLIQCHLSYVRTSCAQATSPFSSTRKLPHAGAAD